MKAQYEAAPKKGKATLRRGLAETKLRSLKSRKAKGSPENPGND